MTAGDVELLALAARCEQMGYITCPMCGEDDFDILGFSLHISRWCEVEKAIGESQNNTEVAASLRARASLNGSRGA